MWHQKIEQTPRHVLNRYFSADYPLGPLDARRVLKEHSFLLDLLAERDLVTLQQRVERPSIIVGRRGSGKTSYLRKLGHESPTHLFVEIRTDRAFNILLASINNIIRDAITVESISSIWDAILWNGFFWLLYRTGRPKVGHVSIQQHLRTLHIDNCESLESVFNVFSRTMEQIAKQTSGFAIDRIAETLRGVKFEDLKAIASSDLAKEDSSAIVVMDSLDEYPVRDADFKKTLAGLLKCAGEFNVVNRNYQFRLCLPSELYWEFREKVSTNPQKDFSSQVVVRWQVSELLIAACRRLMINLYLTHPKAYAAVQHNPLETRRDADAFLAQLFPSDVKNLNGRYEKTDTYLLRHTQLLPRQMLLLLSSILKTKAVNEDFEPGKVPFFSEDGVRDGVRITEDSIVDEIFSVYRDRYGELPADACATIIPSLPRVFTADQFARAVKMYSKESGRQFSVAKLKRMFLEIGAFGKLDQPDSIYRRARFEYTMTTRLPIGEDDQLCVHPLFSRRFECQATDALDPPILPWTSGI